MRKRISPSAVLWLSIGALYFMLPLLAMLIFSLRSGTTGKCCTSANYKEIVDDPEFWRSLRQSFVLSIETIIVSLALLIPTVYWVHLKLPRLRSLIGFLALIPFVIPPIILVVGLLDFYKGTPQWFYAQPYGFLVAAYVILAFPYIYFSLDSGFRAIDVHTLTEASQSLGGTWRTTLFRVILPNIRTAALAGAFLTLAIVMGEFTIANLAAFHTFPIYIQYINETKAYPAGAVSLLSFGITWAAMLSLLLVGRGRPVQMGGARKIYLVELETLHRSFGEVVALDGISISLEEGEFLSLLGPSGCGKTTALRLVAGFDRPNSGRIMVAGKDMTRVPPNKRDMGMVFQAYSLFPNMSASRNVEYGLKIRGTAKQERATKVAELLELVGLGHAGDRYPHQLSGGMQQRVALARALAIEPRVLLLDEPLSALDAKVRVQLREEIRRIQSRLGITTLYVTHDQEEALSISDRVAVLSHGRIEQIAAPGEIYDAPATPFVAEFVGTMNRLEGTVADDGIVAYGEKRLAIAAVRGRTKGERVMVLVRPETVELQPANGDGAGVITGEIVSHTFLGAMMRLKLTSGDSEVTADVPATRANAYPVGMRVQARFPGETARVLTLESSPAADPDGH